MNKCSGVQKIFVSPLIFKKNDLHSINHWNEGHLFNESFGILDMFRKLPYGDLQP